jgi:hypothetical protein
VFHHPVGRPELKSGSNQFDAGIGIVPKACRILAEKVKVKRGAWLILACGTDKAL